MGYNYTLNTEPDYCVGGNLPKHEVGSMLEGCPECKLKRDLAENDGLVLDSFSAGTASVTKS